jgi:hypothetical protein
MGMDKSKISAIIVCDSIGRKSGVRITTFQVRVPKFLLQEIARHRALSLSFNSSRAIPAKTICHQVWHDLFIPISWGSNRAGMVAGKELVGWRLKIAPILWIFAARTACIYHYLLSAIGLHKQHVNRILEGFVWADGVITSTEWQNLFDLRMHPDAQPEFSELATQMRDLLHSNSPQILDYEDWHLPYISETDRKEFCTEDLKMLSASRCARVSYGLAPFDYERDMARADKLLNSCPIHASPFEHVAQPAGTGYLRSGNYIGWHQYRKELETLIE